MDEWKARFYEKPVESLEDRSRAVCQTIFLSGMGAKVGGLSVFLANSICEHFGEAGFDCPIQPLALFRYARNLKGSPLTEKEMEEVRVLDRRKQDRFYRSHQEAFWVCVHRCLHATQLDRRIGGTRDIEKALRILREESQLYCDHTATDRLTEGQLMQLLNEDVPVLIEKQGKNYGLFHGRSKWETIFAAHRNEPTVKHLAPQILEIFKEHPEAQRYLEEHPELKGEAQ